jgi:hypothetical protein
LLYCPFDDPTAATGNATRRLDVSHQVRDEMAKRVTPWISMPSFPESHGDRLPL